MGNAQQQQQQQQQLRLWANFVVYVVRVIEQPL